MQTLRHSALTALLFTAALSLKAQMAPDFTVTDSDGNEHTLYEDYLDQGKTVMLKIFFTTCPPCNAIAPYMQPLYEEWGAGNYDVEFFELSDKNFDTDALVNSYQANHGQTFPGVGAEGGSLDAVAPYKQGMFGQFFGTPTFVVIAPDGTVQFDIPGFNIQDRINNIDAAIAATGAEKPECTVTVAIDEVICAGDSVEVHGTWYDAPGVYQEVVEDDDCDTLLWITIGELPLETMNITTSFCTGDSVEVNGSWYSSGGIYLDTAQGIGEGCDTALTILVTENPLFTRSVSASFNEGDSVQVYGSWYAMPGVFEIISESLTGGCDTVVTLTITEIPVNDPDVTITGRVRTFHNGAGIAHTVVQVWLGGAEVARDTTNGVGEYSFTMDSSYVRNNDLEVRLSKTVRPENGVSVLDLVALQKHLLGIELLNATDKLFAADLNNSGTISVLDIVELRKFLLGLIPGFPAADSPSWMFFHESINLGPPGFQPPVIMTPDPILLRQILDGTQSGNFRGLKRGDLNYSVNPQE